MDKDFDLILQLYLASVGAFAFFVLYFIIMIQLDKDKKWHFYAFLASGCVAILYSIVIAIESFVQYKSLVL